MAAYDLPVSRPSLLSYTNAGADARGALSNIETARNNRINQQRMQEALDWTLGEEERKRKLDAERVMETQRLFDEGILQQRRGIDTDTAFSNALDSQKIMTLDNNANLVNENGGVAMGFRDRNERETPAQYLAAQQAWKQSQIGQTDPNVSQEGALLGAAQEQAAQAKRAMEAKIFSDPGNWADPAQLEATMRAGLKQKGFSDEAINTEINGLLSQHYSTLDPTVAAQRIKDLGSKKTTVETFADQLFPKQFAPSGTNSSGQPVNAQGMTAAQHQDYVIEGAKYVDEWIDDQKLKKGTRKWWVNGVDVGSTDVFTDDVPKFVEALGTRGIPPAVAIRMLDADMRNKTIKGYDLKNLSGDQLDAFAVRAGVPSGQQVGSGTGGSGSGYAGVDTNELLSRDANERAGIENLIQDTIAATQRRAKFTPDQLLSSFGQEGLLREGGLTSQRKPDRALLGMDQLTKEQLSYANTVPAKAAKNKPAETTSAVVDSPLLASSTIPQVVQDQMAGEAAAIDNRLFAESLTPEHLRTNAQKQKILNMNEEQQIMADVLANPESYSSAKPDPSPREFLAAATEYKDLEDEFKALVKNPSSESRPRMEEIKKRMNEIAMIFQMERSVGNNGDLPLLGNVVQPQPRQSVRDLRNR